MKNQKLLLVLMLGIFVVFQSCEKKGIINVENEKNEMLIDETGEEYNNVIYYYNDKPIKTNPFKLRDDKSLAIKNIIVVLGSKEDEKQHKITINSFDTDEAYILFGKKNGIPVAEMLNKEAKIKKFISDNNIEEIYEKTGKIPESYINFTNKLLNNNKIASPLNIYKDYSGGGAWAVVNAIPTLKWTTWNNAISRYYDHASYGGSSWYDGYWHKYRMATLWNWGFQNVRFQGPLSYLNDRTSSIINW